MPMEPAPAKAEDEYGFQPIIVFDGEGWFVAALLPPARRPSGWEIASHLSRLIRMIRATGPGRRY